MMDGIGRRPTVFRQEQVARDLVRAFHRSFFERDTPIDVFIPELKGFELTGEEFRDPEARLGAMGRDMLTISEAYVGEAGPDGLMEPRFPLILITYPDFEEVPPGIGSMVNHQDSYLETGPNSPSFTWIDSVGRRAWELSYATEERRYWQVLRYLYNFSIAIDVIAGTIETRKELADLLRTMWSQHIGSLTHHELSREVSLASFQFETDDDMTSLSDPLLGIERTYPAFFPHAETRVSFDQPNLLGGASYDGVEVFGSESQYVATFSIEGVRQESFRLVERAGGPGFYTGRMLDPIATPPKYPLRPGNARERARAMSRC